MISRHRLPKLPRPLSPQVPVRKNNETYQPYFQKLTLFKAQIDKLEPHIKVCLSKAENEAKAAVNTLYKIYQVIQNASLGDLVVIKI